MLHPRLVAVLATTALLASFAAPAAAQVRHWSDPRGDVWRFDASGETRSERRVNVDLVRTRVSHGEHRLRFRARYVALRRTDQWFALGTTIRTPDRTVDAYVDFEPDDRRGTVHLDGRTCAGLRRSISYAEDRVTMSIPRRCLGRPAWVRVNPGAAVAAAEDRDPVFLDDARSAGSYVGSELSRRLYHR